MTDPVHPTTPAPTWGSQPTGGPTPPSDAWNPTWAVPATPAPPTSAAWAPPPGPVSAMQTPAPGWAWIPDIGWVPLGAPVAAATPGPSSSASPTSAPVPSPWVADSQTAGVPGPSQWPSSPMAAVAPSPLTMSGPMAPYPGIPAAAMPLEPVMPSTAKRRRGGPSPYAVTLTLAAILCAAGVGFAAGRMTDSATGAGTLPTFPTGGAFGARNPGTNGTGTNNGTSTTTGAGIGTTAGTGTIQGTGSTLGDGSTALAADASPSATLAPTSGGTTPGQGPDGGGFPGRGFPGGGFGGGFAVTGDVTAIGDGTITVQTENGQTQVLVTDASTAYHQETVATSADVEVGSSVRVSTSGGFPGRGQGGPGSGTPTDGSTAMTATDVLLLEP